MNRMDSSVELARDLMKRYPSAEDYPYKSWSYPQGYLLMGISHLYERTGEKVYFDYIYEYCDRHVSGTGEVKGFTGCSMDDMMTGAVLVWIYEQTGEERFALACHRIYESFGDYPRTREGGFLHDRFRYPGEMWVDGVFMGQMFYCRYGKVFGKTECFREAVRQLEVIYGYCHIHDGLLLHGYSEDSLADWADQKGHSCSIWSEGLGWYALILAQILELMPADLTERKVPERFFRELLEGLKKYQDPESGLWFQVVDKPEDPRNWCDTSGSGMFLYAIVFGIEQGLADEAEFGPVIERACEGLKTRIRSNTENGHLDIVECCNGLCVQRKEEDYYNYPKTVNAQEAVCSVLWGLEAVSRLQGRFDKEAS